MSSGREQESLSVLIDEQGLKLLLVAQLAVTLTLVGVIWIVQIVHYPLFSGVGSAGFTAYAAEHSRRISYVVVPLMLAELGAAVLFVLHRPASIGAGWAWLGLALVGSIWLSTFLVQVPQHAILGAGFDERAYRLLVQTNWIRTIAWSVRGGLLVWLTARLLG
jgi:hypothetical protein